MRRSSTRAVARRPCPASPLSADNVVVQGFISAGADSTGIWASGENVTVQDNMITQVQYNGDDVDGIRFFGDGPRCCTTRLRPRGQRRHRRLARRLHADLRDIAAGQLERGDPGQPVRGDPGPVPDGRGPQRRGRLGRGREPQLAVRGQLLRRVRGGAVGRARGHPGRDDHAQRDGRRGRPRRSRWARTPPASWCEDNRIGPGYGREVGFDDPSAQEGYNGPEAY